MEKTESQKRQIAYKLKINQILGGTYHQQEGWNPNYLLTQNNQKVSRVNLIAVVVSQTQDQTTNLVLDDGSGQITARIFDLPKNPLPKIGDTIIIIAKIREYNNQKYLMPEIIKTIKDQKWIEVRKLELKNIEAPKKPEEKEEEKEISLAPYENILDLIKKLDQGQGADVDQIIKQSTLSDCEKLIEELLKEGDIFEISPGKVKILK